MGYQIKQIANFSANGEKWHPVTYEKLVITKADPNWDACYQAWKSGKNPTDSPLWKFGVIAHFEEIVPVEV